MSVKRVTGSVGPEFLCKLGYLMNPRPSGDGWDEHYYILRGSFLRKCTTGRLLPLRGGILPKLYDNEVEYVLTGSLVRDGPETQAKFEVELLLNRDYSGTCTIKFKCQYEEEKNAWTQAIRLASTQKMAPPVTLVDTAQRMLNIITCRDRRHHFRVYKQCFRGDKAMACLVKETSGNYKEAYDLATRLSECGLVYHVKHKRDLCDGFHFFRFAACVGNGAEGNGNDADVLSSGILEEEAEEGESTDSEEGFPSNDDVSERIDSLDVSYSALEGSQLSREVRVELVKAPRSLSMSLLDTKEAELMARSVPPSSQLDVFQQPTLGDISERNRVKIQTRMGLPSDENMLDGAGSLEKEISGLSVPESDIDAALASLPLLSEWEQWPVLFRISPSLSPNVRRLDCKDPFAPIRINCNDVSVPFETNLFRGRVIVRMSGLPNAEDYFRGRKRLTDLVVQGQFLRPVRFDRLMTGQKFSSKLKAVHGGLARVAVGLIKKLQPSVEIDLLSNSPFWLNPVVTTAQALQVEQEGSEMDITGDIKENTVILGSNFSKNTVSPGARKKYFSHLENLKGYSFEPGVVWTFAFYQHYFDAVKNKINTNLKLFAPRCNTYIGHQPISLMAVDVETGEHAWKFEIWHADSVKAHRNKSLQDTDTTRTGEIDNELSI